MVDYDRKQGERMSLKNDVVFIISVLIALLALIATVGFNKYSELKSMERNIESAIVKGIDPLAVRCAYGDSTWICMQYASTHGKESNISKK
jgi:hypothetical protein